MSLVPTVLVEVRCECLHRMISRLLWILNTPLKQDLSPLTVAQPIHTSQQITHPIHLVRFPDDQVTMELTVKSIQLYDGHVASLLPSLLHLAQHLARFYQLPTRLIMITPSTFILQSFVTLTRGLGLT